LKRSEKESVGTVMGWGVKKKDEKSKTSTKKENM